MKIIKTIMVGVAGLTFLTVAACNTIEGAGKDIEQAGDHIEQRAEEANPGN